MRANDRIWLCGAALAAAAGCGIKTNQVSIGQKTSLERQLMGSVEPLSEEEMLVASVRGPGAGMAGSREDLQGRAIAARRRQLFNRDDIDELKAAGCIGEAQDGLLAARSCARQPAAELAALRDGLLSQENEDRRVLIDWALAVDPVLTSTDRPKVVAIYRRLQLEKTRPGDWVQNDDGSWTQR